MNFQISKGPGGGGGGGHVSYGIPLENFRHFSNFSPYLYNNSVLTSSFNTCYLVARRERLHAVRLNNPPQRICICSV